MATIRPLLRLNATVFDGRLHISFSYLPAAQIYKEYLQKPENSYNDEHEWEVAISATEVSMNLPSDISVGFPGGSKNTVLTFEDEAKAKEWEGKMVLWEQRANQAKETLSISQSMTIERLSERLGKSIGDSPSLFHVECSGAQINAPILNNNRSNLYISIFNIPGMSPR